MGSKQNEQVAKVDPMESVTPEVQRAITDYVGRAQREFAKRAAKSGWPQFESVDIVTGKIK